MALNWDVSRVKHYKVLHTDENEARLTDCIIWATMAVGISHIGTEKTADEFYARVHLFETLYGTYRTGPDGKSKYITKADIYRRIGLKTNASDFTRPQFIKLKVGRWLDERLAS